MRLAAAASIGDTVQLFDAYTGLPALKGQFDLFDDAKRDGGGSERRILAVAPDIAIPARHAVIEPESGEVWLVGNSHTDYFNGRAIRRKFVVHRATALSRLGPPADFLENSVSTQAWAAVLWIKDAKQIEEASTAPALYDVVLAANEHVPENSIIQCGDRTLWGRDQHLATGFCVAEAEDISSARTTVTVGTRHYDPVRDKTTDTPLQVDAFVLRWQTCYRNDSAAALSFEQGDKVIVVAKSAVAGVKVGDSVLVHEHALSIVSIEDGDAAWHLHARSR